jgi:hypothetical protein
MYGLSHLICEPSSCLYTLVIKLPEVPATHEAQTAASHRRLVLLSLRLANDSRYAHPIGKVCLLEHPNLSSVGPGFSVGNDTTSCRVMVIETANKRVGRSSGI